MKLKYTKWDDVSLGLYKKLAAISGDNSLSEEEKNVEMAALLCDCEPEDIWNMDMADAKALFGQMTWINDFKPDFKKPEKKTYVLNGIEYKVTLDINEMSVAGYVDFQNYYGEGIESKNMAEILSCFLIPKGHKYNEGYDVAQVIDDINNYLPFVEAQRICFFFLRKQADSLRAIQIFSTWMMKKEMRKVKEPQKKAELQKKIKEVEDLYGPLFWTKFLKLRERHGTQSGITR